MFKRLSQRSQPFPLNCTTKSTAYLPSSFKFSQMLTFIVMDFRALPTPFASRKQKTPTSVDMDTYSPQPASEHGSKKMSTKLAIRLFELPCSLSLPCGVFEEFLLPHSRSPSNTAPRGLFLLHAESDTERGGGGRLAALRCVAGHGLLSPSGGGGVAFSRCESVTRVEREQRRERERECRLFLPKSTHWSGMSLEKDKLYVKYHNWKATGAQPMHINISF